jgi:hypothetical protein
MGAIAAGRRKTAVERLHALAMLLFTQIAPALLKTLVLVFLLFFAAPLMLRAALDWRAVSAENWHSADWSSAGRLPRPEAAAPALVRVYAARTGRWRGIFAVHTWIVVKERGARRYTRYDYTAWGDPIRIDGFAPDGRWFGAIPETVVSVDGEQAERLIPKIRAVIESYRFSAYGDYSPWPGPNSNTFIQAALDAVPDLQAVLPPTAIGKDFPYHGKWLGVTPSRTGVFASLGGYLGLTVGWVEGIELNFFGGVLGLDLRRPALKFPGLGRLGMPTAGRPGKA